MDSRRHPFLSQAAPIIAAGAIVIGGVQSAGHFGGAAHFDFYGGVPIAYDFGGGTPTAPILPVTPPGSIYAGTATFGSR
jgi:hypothetical protein